MHVLVTRQKFGAEPEPEKEIEVEVNEISIEERAARRVMADGGVSAAETQDPSGSDGCPHGRTDCEGVDSDRERPVLCFDCWGCGRDDARSIVLRDGRPQHVRRIVVPGPVEFTVPRPK